MTTVWPRSDLSNSRPPQTVAELQEMAKRRAACDPNFNPDFKPPPSLSPNSVAFQILARLVQ